MPFDPLDTPALTQCGDAELLSAQADLVADRRLLDARLAAVAGEIARRSAPDAGMAGLAQRSGDRTPERLIERLAGVDASEARRLIAVGACVRDPESAVGRAVAEGTVSVTSASAIVSELDRVVGDVSAETRTAAEAELVAAAPGLAVSALRREARAVRDELDLDGIPEREERLYERRRLALTPQPDGMTRVDGLLDPESAAHISAAFDHVLSPRRGGPRFVDEHDVVRARSIQSDPRTTEQLMVDALVSFVRLASQAEEAGEVLGSTRPQATVIVTAADLIAGRGPAMYEGQPASVSIATAERATCAGSVPVLIGGDGRVLDLGREQRLFSRRQRRALAARDGGCLSPGCDRPPSWCEAHHADEWSAHRGRTDVARGVLLCAHHHRWVHAGRHRIVHRDGTFGLVHSTSGEFTPWPSKNRLLSRVLAPMT